jgi:cellulose biosynthesis protein BcsQ
METVLSVPELGEVLGITPQGTTKYIKGIKLDKDEESFKGRTRFLTHTGTRKVLESRGFKYPQKNIAFYANKGGVGKTTLAINMAYRASQMGAKVLIFDLDMQANATNTFINYIPKHVFINAVLEDISIQNVIIPIGKGLHLLPSSLSNIRLEVELINKKTNPLTYFEQILLPIRNDYDLIIADLAPSLSHLSYLAVLSSDTIYVPANPDIYSAQGIDITISTINEMQKS